MPAAGAPAPSSGTLLGATLTLEPPSRPLQPPPRATNSSLIGQKKSSSSARTHHPDSSAARSASRTFLVVPVLLLSLSSLERVVRLGKAAGLAPPPFRSLDLRTPGTHIQPLAAGAPLALLRALGRQAASEHSLPPSLLHSFTSGHGEASRSPSHPLGCSRSRPTSSHQPHAAAPLRAELLQHLPPPRLACPPPPNSLAP
jgi:hypothetical protein